MFTTITSKVRNLLGDLSKRGSDVFVYGSSDVFTLSEDNVDDITTVYVNSTELVSGDYSFDTTTNKLTLLNSGNTTGDIIEIIYNYFPNYSTTMIEAYIRASLVHLTASNYFSFTELEGEIYPDPDNREQSLIALVTSVLIDPQNITYRLPDVSVIMPKDVPTFEKIRKIAASFKKDSQAGAGIWGIV